MGKGIRRKWLRLCATASLDVRRGQWGNGDHKKGCNNNVRPKSNIAPSKREAHTHTHRVQTMILHTKMICVPPYTQHSTDEGARHTSHIHKSTPFLLAAKNNNKNRRVLYDERSFIIITSSHLVSDMVFVCVCFILFVLFGAPLDDGGELKIKYMEQRRTKASFRLCVV